MTVELTHDELRNLIIQNFGIPDVMHCDYGEHLDMSVSIPADPNSTLTYKFSFIKKEDIQ